MKIGAKIATGFLIVVLLMTVSGGISWYLLQQIRHSSDQIQDVTLPLMAKTNYAALLGARQVAALRGYVITNDEKFLQEYKDLNKEADAIQAELVAKSITPQGKQYAQEVMALADQYEKIIMEKVVPLQKAGKKEELITLMGTEVAPVAGKLSEKYKEYIKFREKQINDTFDVSQDQMEQAKIIILIFLLIAFISSIVIAVVITRKVAGPIKLAVQDLNTISSGDYSITVPEAILRGKDEVADMARAMDQMVQSMRTMLRKISASADHVASSSEELTASAEQSATAANQVAHSMVDVASGASEQRRYVGEATEHIGQLSEGIDHIAVKITSVAEQSAQSADRAQAGGKAVDKAVSQMVQIETTVNTSAQVVAKLGERSKEIGQIVDAISGIAGQTNLLALNAAIEAARAGEQGRGFAVVAEEVRKLAEQSQEAAKRIADLIQEIQGDTDKAVIAMEHGTREVKTGAAVVDEAGSAFREIADLVTHVSGQIQDISAAVEQMAASSQNVVGAVQRIDSFSDTNASEAQSVSAASEEQLASMEDVASASRSLAHLAQDLQSAVSRFRL